MSKINELEREVEKLSADELAAFRRCFADFDADFWYHQI